jgi:phage shock protein A
MDDDISAVTEDYDPAAVAFQRKMKQVRKKGNDFISQHEENNKSVAESIRSASSKIDEARNMQAVVLDLKSQLETIQIDYEDAQGI